MIQEWSISESVCLYEALGYFGDILNVMASYSDNSCFGDLFAFYVKTFGDRKSDTRVVERPTAYIIIPLL